MSRHISTWFIALPAVIAQVSCSGWLSEESPMLNQVDDFFIGQETALQAVNASYTPLMWEFNETYYSEFFIGDVVSDDALKGGQNVSDMPDAYDMENFKTTTDNTLLLDYYRAKWQGIQRCNLAIEQIPAMELDDTFDETLRDRYVAEARFLRAFYYFQLVRVFGGVPRIETPIYSSDDWIQPRATADEIYSLITEDLEYASGKLPKKSEYGDADLGRATSGAAQAMLLKAYLYWGNMKENAGDAASASGYYKMAYDWGVTFMSEQAGEYTLCQNYRDNFTIAGENGPESVFEIQYTEEATSDYGEGNGFTRGTFATVLTRSRSSFYGSAGWGFCKPTRNLYEEYEEGDPRLDATILDPTQGGTVDDPDDYYLGCSYVAVKRTLLQDNGTYYTLAHDSRSPINYPVIRLADVYLLYAEACLEYGAEGTAKTYLEYVRSRARGAEDILPEFPGYNGYSDTPEDLEKAIRHERRVELALEGHRWFDLCRWGIAKETMDAYKAGETEEARAEMADFVEGKHELFPIPQKEIDLGHLEQNPGY